MRLQDLMSYFELYKSLKNSNKETFLNAELKSKEKEFIGAEITICGIVTEVDTKKSQLITTYCRTKDDGQTIFENHLISQHFYVFASYDQVRPLVDELGIEKDDLLEMRGMISGLHRRSVLRISLRSVTVITRQHSAAQKKAKTGCFIATAVYDPGDQAKIREFYRLRDEVLLRTRAGRLFVQVYYRWSPAMARWIEDKPKIKRWIRTWVLEKLLDYYHKKPG
jgi:hypothetical protein